MKTTKMVLKLEPAPKFYVQETIGGWRQNAAVVGTYEECAAWLEGQHGGSWAIVPEEEYEVDYLD